MKRLFPYLATSLGIHLATLLVLLFALTFARDEESRLSVAQPRPGVVMVDFSSRPENAPTRARTDASGMARLRPAPVQAGGAGGLTQGASSDAEVSGDLLILYPEMSRQLGEEGRVELLLQLSATGAVVGAEITRTSGYKRLDQAALEAVKRARFKPARSLSGDPISSRKPFHVEFKLED